MLGFVSWLRYAAIGLLLYVEVRVLASLYWSVLAGHKSPDAVATDLASLGLPPQIAALLAKEAAFWQRALAKPLNLVRSLRRK